MGYFKLAQTIGKKFVKEQKALKKFLEGQKNIYKKDPTGKKDKIIESMNKTLKEKKHTASPNMIDHYHKVMTSDFEKKTGPFFSKKTGKK